VAAAAAAAAAAATGGRARKQPLRVSDEPAPARLLILLPQGLISEFLIQPDPAAAAPASGPSAARLDALCNGLWALLLSLGLLATGLATRRARSWRFLRGWARGLAADYGCPAAFVAWTALSFAVQGVPGVPRRVRTPDTWEMGNTWAVAGRMAEVRGRAGRQPQARGGHGRSAEEQGARPRPGPHRCNVRAPPPLRQPRSPPPRASAAARPPICPSPSAAAAPPKVPPEFIAGALVPAAVITVLFFFDHNVSSQMAQQPEFNLRRPPAYHYDFLLLSGLVGGRPRGRVWARRLACCLE
jgi:hypothetical protein